MKRSTRRLAATLLGLIGVTCAGPREAPRPPGTVEYVGSSTVAVFIDEAESAYGAIDFLIDTRPESAGGERAIAEGRAQFAGIAKAPEPETLAAGVQATLIGRDAIAVVVNAKNLVRDLSTEQLRGVFTGGVENWSELGGADLPVRPFVASPDSATRQLFRELILGEGDYAGCEEVARDREILDRVHDDEGAISQISFSFLRDATGIVAVAVDGEEPSVTNFDYPIARPLYLLWLPGDPVVEAFVQWASGEEGQRVVMRDFVGTRVLGSVRGSQGGGEKGVLVVYTETDRYNDGGIFYYPHRSYEILDREGRLILRVPNHRGVNDERPTRVQIAPGTYLIRTRSSMGQVREYFATVESGRVTELDASQPGGKPR